MIEKITTQEHLNDMENLIWHEVSRFSVHDFCEQGGFSCDALQDFFDLADIGFKTRNSKQKDRWGNVENG